MAEVVFFIPFIAIIAVLLIIVVAFEVRKRKIRSLMRKGYTFVVSPYGRIVTMIPPGENYSDRQQPNSFPSHQQPIGFVQSPMYPQQPTSFSDQVPPYPPQPTSFSDQVPPYPPQPTSFTNQVPPYPPQPTSFTGQVPPYPPQPLSFSDQAPPYPQQPMLQPHPQQNQPPRY